MNLHRRRNRQNRRQTRVIMDVPRSLIVSELSASLPNVVGYSGGFWNREDSYFKGFDTHFASSIAMGNYATIPENVETTQIATRSRPTSAFKPAALPVSNAIHITTNTTANTGTCSTTSLNLDFAELLANTNAVTTNRSELIQSARAQNDTDTPQGRSTQSSASRDRVRTTSSRRKLVTAPTTASSQPPRQQSPSCPIKVASVDLSVEGKNAKVSPYHNSAETPRQVGFGVSPRLRRSNVPNFRAPSPPVPENKHDRVVIGGVINPGGEVPCIWLEKPKSKIVDLDDFPYYEMRVRQPTLTKVYTPKALGSFDVMRAFGKPTPVEVELRRYYESYKKHNLSSLPRVSQRVIYERNLPHTE